MMFHLVPNKAIIVKIIELLPISLEKLKIESPQQA